MRVVRDEQQGHTVCWRARPQLAGYSHGQRHASMGASQARFHSWNGLLTPLVRLVDWRWPSEIPYRDIFSTEPTQQNGLKLLAICLLSEDRSTLRRVGRSNQIIQTTTLPSNPHAAGLCGIGWEMCHVGTWSVSCYSLSEPCGTANRAMQQHRQAHAKSL